MALNPSVNTFHVVIYSPACYLQWEQKVLTPISSIQLPAEMVKAFPSFTYSIALWMFIGSSSTGPVISMDLCKCLKGSNLKRCLFQAVLVSVGEFGWLSDHVLISGPIKRGKKKVPHLLIWLLLSLGMHMCLVYWSLSDSSIRVVPQALTTGRCGGELTLLPRSCPFLMILVFRLEQAPWLPKVACMLRSWFSQLYPGSLRGKIKGNYLDTKGFLQMYLVFVRTLPWLCFWVQSIKKFSRWFDFNGDDFFSLPAFLS